MTKKPEDPRLMRLTKICLALPEATGWYKGDHASLLVPKKTFAYFLNDHHGDGIVAVTGKVLPGDNNALVEAQPRRFYLPAYIASRGWVALRLDVGKIDWDEVSELVRGSYQLVAPKCLAALVSTRLRSRSPAKMLQLYEGWGQPNQSMRVNLSRQPRHP